MLPPEILQIEGLKELYLGNNPLKSIPYSLSECQTLETLSLNELGLKEVPECVFTLPLKLLSLKKNQLSELSPEILLLTACEHLNLSENKFVKCPESLSSLPKLKVLNLSRNPLQSIESLSTASSLIILSVKNCELEELPLKMDGMKSLNRLHLDENQKLDNLPPSLGNCKELKAVTIKETWIPEERVKEILDNAQKLRLQDSPWLEN